MTLGSRVRKIRKDKGWSLDKLAAKSNSSKTYIWEIEHSKPSHRPSAKLVYDLSVALDTTMEWLVNGSNIQNEADTVFIRRYLNLSEESKKLMQIIIPVFEIGSRL